jgi:hypothetical protein
VGSTFLGRQMEPAPAGPPKRGEMAPIQGEDVEDPVSVSPKFHGVRDILRPSPTRLGT